MEKTRENEGVGWPQDFQHTLSLLRAGSAHVDSTTAQRVLFEQVEANRLAIEELRARHDAHFHFTANHSDKTTKPWNEAELEIYNREAMIE
jgi:hypothetical protein